MPLRYLLTTFVAFLSLAAPVQAQDSLRWALEAGNITITRDIWGIPHVHGHTDADAVFGMIYAQAEDDFNRIETNYLNSMGRLAEAEGEHAIYQDLRMKLFIQPDTMRALYASSPVWLKALMDAWADGLNYYLHTHPDTKPRVLTRFEPWMALTFSEGSIGGDIERVSLRGLEAFYGSRSGAGSASGSAGALGDGEPSDGEPRGSNGIAIAPANTRDHHALLLINPHTSFFFRSELQMTSDEGLNAYGAVTWGQFFVYQGFNERAGWMHTSSGVDNIDEYAETIERRRDSVFYRYGGTLRPVIQQRVAVPYRTSGGMRERVFTVYRTHHGPVVRKADGHWISVRLMNEPLAALTQSYTRTRAHNYADFRHTMELHTNSSNNTIFADADGNIAYLHANFIPTRDTSFDWSRPVDGSNPATEWGPLLSVEQSPLVVNPPVGWLYNSNNWPYSAAGPDSPRRTDYPSYVDRGGESFRGLHALRVLTGVHDFTVASLRAAAFDSYLTGFEEMLPSLFRAYDRAAASDPRRAALAEPIAALRAWDRRWSVSSVPTTLAVYWGEQLGFRRSDTDTLQAFAAAADTLTARFGTWKTPWGDVNRFQRLTGDIVQPFTDAGPSIPVGFTSSRWGSLASFGAREYPGTKKKYGTSGNSFVAVVQFGDSVRAIAVTAGGESGDPASPHFNDQAERYVTGNLREVYFYPAAIAAHAERRYHPGE